MADRLKFTTPLSSTGIRVLHLDLTKPLSAANEVLTGTSPTVTTDPPGLVSVSNVVVNGSPLTNKDGSVAQVGKAVQWKATSLKPTTGKVVYRVSWAVAAGGSADTHEIEQDLEPFIRQ